jgi:hypothetical protein
LKVEQPRLALREMTVKISRFVTFQSQVTSEHGISMIKLGINGFGRIGRMVFRAAIQNFSQDIEVVGINDLLEPEYLAYMLKFDSVHGRFKGEVSTEGTNLIVNGKSDGCEGSIDSEVGRSWRRHRC